MFRLFFHPVFRKAFNEFIPPTCSFSADSIVPRLRDHAVSDPDTFWPLPVKTVSNNVDSCLGNDDDEHVVNDDGLTPAEAFVHYAKIISEDVDDGTEVSR